MDHIELLQRLAVALGIGLLIGLERGWAGRDEADGERALGLRTLGLSGLLGGVIGAIALLLPQAGAPLLAVAFLAHAAVIALFRAREMVADRTYGATTVVAAILVFGLGAFAVMVDKGIAAAAGVAAAALLALKPVLHAWVRRITWPELRSALVLLAMSVILLPVLPDRGFGPWGALNPHRLWAMTILIAAVSAVGYVAIRVAGERWGIMLSAIVGALVSSTAVTLSLARLSVSEPQRTPVLAAGILLANATMLVRILVVAGIIEPALLAWLAAPILVAVGALLPWVLLRLRASPALSQPQAITLVSPFELATVLKFGALLAVIMLATRALTELSGPWGAYAVAAASGIGDVDAVTLSMAQLSGRDLTYQSAAAAILLAAAVNTVSKVVLARGAGTAGLGRALAVPLVLAAAAGAMTAAALVLRAA